MSRIKFSHLSKNMITRSMAKVEAKTSHKGQVETSHGSQVETSHGGQVETSHGGEEIVIERKFVSNNYPSLILEAVKDLKERVKGSSRTSIKKYIEESHKVKLSNALFREALKSLVADGRLTQNGQRFLLTTL